MLITLTELGELHGLLPKVVIDRHKRGDRTIERLTRPYKDMGGVRKGETLHLSKLDEKSVLEIRELYKKENNYSKIGRMYGVSHATIRHIVKRHTWKHI